MMKMQWKGIAVGLLLLGGIGAGPWEPVANAASGDTPTASRRGPNGFLVLLQHKVGLTPEQMDGVKGLLSAQRQQMSSIREQTDAKIRALLTSQQQPKFDAALAEMKSRRSKTV